MHQSVRDAFFDFSAPMEGVVPWMYLDVRGLVTVGVGNLLPDANAAAALPFHRKDNPDDLADDDAKRQGWRDVYGRQDLASIGHTAFKGLCELRLSDHAIRSLVDAKLSTNEATLVNYFPQFDDWPADAQLGLHSMAWALGPAFVPRWPNFSAACRAMDFERAALECRMREEGNPGVAPRNRANALLFTNAARVLALGPSYGYTREDLYYPTVILEEVVVTPDGGGP